MRPVPSARIRDVNDAPIRAERGYVLHWITAHRRLEHNFTLDHSVVVMPMSKKVSGYVMSPLGHHSFSGVDIAE